MFSRRHDDTHTVYLKKLPEFHASFFFRTIMVSCPLRIQLLALSAFIICLLYWLCEPVIVEQQPLRRRFLFFLIIRCMFRLSECVIFLIGLLRYVSYLRQYYFTKVIALCSSSCLLTYCCFVGLLQRHCFVAFMALSYVRWLFF